jgi:hypothetical protein
MCTRTAFVLRPEGEKDALPHYLVVVLGAEQVLGDVSYLPRQDLLMDELANSASTQPRRPFLGLIGSTQRHGLDAFVNSAGHKWQQQPFVAYGNPHGLGGRVVRPRYAQRAGWCFWSGYTQSRSQ